MARTWADIEKLGLTDAEKRLVECCKAGEVCRLADERPEAPSDAHTIRAEVLRYLILGGCPDCRVHELGVRLVGAWVRGRLDLSFATAKGPTSLVLCGFASKVECLQARLELLALNGSALPGLNLQGAQVTGHVLLRDGFVAEGEVSLSGAVIGGQLECTKGQFLNPVGKALNAEGARIMGDVFLRSGFVAKGAVRLMGAVIGGQLSCTKGLFQSTGGDAVNAQRMRVSEGLYWRGVVVKEGIVDLASAHVGDLVDDLDSWPDAGRNYLNGFTYDKIGGEFTAVNSRLKWLARGDTWQGEFHPQPYTHLAKVYRSMGRDADARTVLIERNRLLAQHQRKALRAGPEEPTYKDVVVGWNWFKDFGLRNLVGYGYAPFRSVKWLLILWFAAVWLAAASWHEGSMVPNSPVILTSADWQAYESRTHAGAEWSASTAPGQDWETFNRYAWGADLVIPILDLGQTQAWAPSTARGGWGYCLWWAQWFLEAAGWIVAGLFAAAITGIIRKDDD